jgi:hypothetical protein
MQYSINAYPGKLAPFDFREHVEEQSFVPHRFRISMGSTTGQDGA